ncbi:MAG TPA: M48 family metalloprotease [Candidatus Acidoferrum sp.]|nr:M48 family metalloprotease [Candidatus Acidoferrum sp.]
MRSPKILLGRKKFVAPDKPGAVPARPAGGLRSHKGSEERVRNISELPAFAWPTLALLALLMLALLVWPVTASAQAPAGAGGQQPPTSDPQAPPPAPPQQPQQNQTAQQGSQVTAGDGAPAQAAIRPQQPMSAEAVLDRIIAQELAEVGTVRQYSPLVETYIQYLRSDKTTGAAPDGDRYFLGRAEMSRGVDLMPLGKDASLKHRVIGSWSQFFNSQFLPRGFLQMIFIDMNGFDRQHYRIEYVRREFLGEVRCLVFDVDPVSKKDKGRFVGRIWVEDQDFHIVRFNGAFGGSSLTSDYLNFDSWRTNVGKNLWLPSFIYSEQGSIHDKKTINIGYKAFRAQTRLWGYDLGHARQEQELNKVLVEAAGVRDAEGANDYSPLQSERSWSHQAEDSVTDRLERIGLLAPYGEVDKILETVVNNLEVTNNLDIQPEVRCRVLMTSTLESFTIGHTIVLSRGLIDVLPDEASLGAILAHELGHVALGHRIDSQYAFFSRVRFDDKDTFKHFDFTRTRDEEEAAQQKGIELLKNSPYKDKAASAQVFLQAVQSRVKEIPNLISPHLGDRVSASRTVAEAALAGQPGTGKDKDKDEASDKTGAPEEKVDKNAIAALPLGGRIKIDPWNDQLRMLKSKAAGTVAEAENTPFQITPFVFYLTRVADNSPAPTMTAAAPGAAPRVEAAAQMDAPPKPEVTQDLPGRPAPEPRKP